MIKNLGVYLVSFTLLATVGFFIHQAVLQSANINLQFLLQNVYVFHAIASLLICGLLNFLQTFKKFQSQIGFLYLGTLFIKIIAFSIVFKKVVIDTPVLSKTSSLNLLITLMIFLTAEVYFVAKILNRKEANKLS